MLTLGVGTLDHEALGCAHKTGTVLQENNALACNDHDKYTAAGNLTQSGSIRQPRPVHRPQGQRRRPWRLGLRLRKMWWQGLRSRQAQQLDTQAQPQPPASAMARSPAKHLLLLVQVLPQALPPLPFSSL